MKAFDGRTLPTSKSITLTVVFRSVRPQPSSPRTDAGVEVLALKWFAQMQMGQIDRTQLTPDYSAHLTDVAVRGMSRYLREYKYGVSPTWAEVLQSRTSGEQTPYVVELLFPRGRGQSLVRLQC